MTSGYSLAAAVGASLSLGTGGRVWAEGVDVTATISAPITGTGALTKIGSGTIILAGVNTYQGGTVISAGTLQVNADEALGAASGGLTFDGGTLKFTSAISTSRDVILLSGGGTLSWSEGDVVMMSGVISGEGSITLTGGGLFSLANANSYSGGTIVTGGSALVVGDDSSLGATSGVLTLSGGTLVTYEVFGPVTIARDVVLVGTENAFSIDNTLTLSGLVSGSGGVTSYGTGTLVLAGTNSYAGGTTVYSGTLQVASDANLGAASGGLTLAGGTLSTTASFTSARSVVLGELGSSGLSRARLTGGTFQVADGTVLTLSGVISGAGTLTKTGTGTLVLTGENTYSGLTTISAGTLQLGNGGTTGSITGDVVNNASLVFNRSDTYSFPGTISGSGTVTFMGGGTVLFETPGAYSGPITVADATLTLESGSQSGSVFTVGNGGLIKGNGEIGGLVVNAGGIAAPGNSPGTITVTGAVSFNAGAIYRVDVTPSGAHDLITATGLVTLSSGASVQVVAERGVYAANATYAIVTTTGTVTGTFGSVTSDYVFLTPSLSYDAQTVYLTLAYEESAPLFAAYAQTPNQLSTAVGAQALGLGNAVFDALLTQSAASLPGALNALSGEAYASVDTVIQQQSVYVREAVGSRLRSSLTAPGASALGYAAQAGAPQTATLGGGLTPTLWAQGYGGWGNSFSNGNAASITNSLGGFLIGADVALAPNARAGLFGGFSQSQFDVTDRSSTGSMDNYDLGAYAGAQFGAWALRGGVSYSWHDVSMERTVAFPGFVGATDGGYTLGTTQLFGEIGYDLAVGAYAFEPFLGLAYVNISGGSLSEGGGSAAALSVDLQSMSTLYSTLGLRAATSFQVNGRALTPSVTVGWQHAFGDTTPSATMLFSGGTLPFQVSGVPIAEDALLLGANLSYALSDVASLGVSYTGQLAATASQNAFTAQFSLRF